MDELHFGTRVLRLTFDWKFGGKFFKVHALCFLAGRVFYLHWWVMIVELFNVDLDFIYFL